MELRIHICFWLKLGFKRLVLLVEDVMCDSGVGLRFDEDKDRWHIFWRTQVDGKSKQRHLHVNIATFDGNKAAGERVAEHLRTAVQDAADRSDASLFWAVRDRLIAEALSHNASSLDTIRRESSSDVHPAGTKRRHQQSGCNRLVTQASGDQHPAGGAVSDDDANDLDLGKEPSKDTNSAAEEVDPWVEVKRQLRVNAAERRRLKAQSAAEFDRAHKVMFPDGVPDGLPDIPDERLQGKRKIVKFRSDCDGTIRFDCADGSVFWKDANDEDGVNSDD